MGRGAERRWGEKNRLGSGSTVDWISGNRNGWVGKICGGGDMAEDSGEGGDWSGGGGEGL